ncbi:MAG: Ig-like domain-containing protein [Acidimicrobiales bacterium]
MVLTPGDDAQTFTEDTGGTITVLANDSDPNNDSLTITSLTTTGLLGAVSHNSTTITYDPQQAFQQLAAGHSLTTSFEYTVTDGRGGYGSATVVPHHRRRIRPTDCEP